MKKYSLERTGIWITNKRKNEMDIIAQVIEPCIGVEY